MIRCEVCGERIRPTKGDVYLVPVSMMNFSSQYYECTDCPRCSCQVVLNTRYGEKRKIEHTKREDGDSE